jgi:UDP-N-acetylmuramate--alanine ligase
MSGYTNRIGVSGMHGKSTTTAMLEQIFRIGDKDPTVSCGAAMKDVDGRCDRIGGEDYFIFEACEYMDSFLDFYPTDVVVLNIEPDHLDYFRDIYHIEESFAQFLDRAGSQGVAYLNLGDDNVMRASKNFDGRTVTFGVENPDADYSAEDIVMEFGRPTFTITHHGEPVCRISMHVPGAHIICDALAASAVALEHGLSPDDIAIALSEFDGAARRMDRRGATAAGAVVFDDYAHHPTEITSTLNSAASMEFDRIFCVFQPHTYSRTKELFDDFVSSLAHEGVHKVLLAEIYSARETDTRGVSSAMLAEQIRARGVSCQCYPTFEDIVRTLKTETGKNDMILIMGAGDINTISTSLV